MYPFLSSEMTHRIVNLHLPRYEQLPALDLYMDQVISVVNTALRPLFSNPDGSILTPTMVGNYVKQKLIPPPVKKRYTRSHVVYLIAVVLLKQVYSITEVHDLIQRQVQTVTLEEAYDYFCDQLEASLQNCFSTTGQADPGAATENPLELICFVVSSLAHKIYVQKYLEFQKLPLALPEPTQNP